MSKQTTVSLPDGATYKSAKEVGLGVPKSLSVPQAQGGRYRVAVGGSLNANETSMGRLANSLKGVSSVLGSYADIRVEQEERGLAELRRMSNEKKRELIGAENKVFRKMGIRPQSMLQVMHALGTAESGKFQGEWQEYLENELIPSQQGGTPLSSEEIQKAYVKFRQGWTNSNEFLGKSQLATDGFLADTDGLYDRNSAYYFKAADGYYEQNVQRFSASEAIMATASTKPEELARVITENFSAMDGTTSRAVVQDMVTKAVQSGDVSMMETMQTVLTTMAAPKNSIKLGGLDFSKTATFSLMKLRLNTSQDDARYKKTARESQLLKLEDEKLEREVKELFADYKVKMKNLEGQPAKQNELKISTWTLAQKYFEPVGEGLFLDLSRQLNSAMHTLGNQSRADQKLSDDKTTQSILTTVQNAVFRSEDTAKINALIEQKKTEVDDNVANGSLSEKAAQELKNQLNSLGNSTTQKGLRTTRIGQLAERSKIDPELRAGNREQSYYVVMNAAKAGMLDKNGNPISKFARADAVEIAGANPMEAYSFQTGRLNIAARGVFIDYENDVQAERERLSKQAFYKFSPNSGGELTVEMDEYINDNLKGYIKERQSLASQQLITIHEQREQAMRNQEMISKGYSIGEEDSEFDIAERFKAMQAWETSKEAGADEDMFIFTQEPRTGEANVTIRTNRFDLDATKPFAGRQSDKHVQFRERFEMLNEREAITIGTGQDKKSIAVFDALSDESKSQLSARYAESLQLVDGVYGEKHINKLLRNIDRGQLMYRTPMARGMGGMQGIPQTDDNPFNLNPQMRFDDQTYQGRREAINKVMTAYKLSSVPTEHWQSEDYGGNSEFTLRGPDGDVKSGLGYKNRKDLAFVPRETIQKLHNFVTSDKAVGNMKADLSTGLASLPADEITVVKDALKYFYITEGITPQQALSQLFNNHRAIYSINQGHSFDQ